MSSADSHPPFASQESSYVGLHLHDILYGIELCLYLKTMHIFLTHKRPHQNSVIFYAIFSTVMLLLLTIWVAFLGLLTQEAWLSVLVNPNRTITFAYINVVAVVGFILQLMTDALMIYRCHVVWDGFRIVTIPVIMWLATLTLGVMVIWAASSTRTNFFSGDAIELGLAYYTMSVVLNVTLTCMICYRLVRYAKTVKECLGAPYASPYYTIMMILVESVLPATACGIAYLVSYGMGSETEIAISHVYTVMMCVSPQMLILRVAEGSAWRRDTMKRPLPSMKFCPGCQASSISEVSNPQSGGDSRFVIQTS